MTADYLFFQPNDENEQDRMDLGHHIYLLITGGRLYLAPIINPQRVLDLGTGTGKCTLLTVQQMEQSVTRASSGANSYSIIYPGIWPIDFAE